MNKNIIYCFSGTGNSLKAAIEISKCLNECEIISMRCNPEDVPAINAEVIGFVFPVYHWTMPDSTKKFIERLQVHKSAYIFGIASCGGLPVNALNDLSDLLKAKKTRLSYAKVHHNVASYIAAYNPFPNPSKKLPKAKAELEDIVNDINKRVYNKIPTKSVLKEFMRIINKPFAVKLPVKDKGFNVSAKCVSCGLCKEICIVHNIEIINSKPVFKHHCSQCMACIVYCPVNAINYKNKTQKRTKYHHPDIKASDLIADKLAF